MTALWTPSSGVWTPPPPRHASSLIGATGTLMHRGMVTVASGGGGNGGSSPLGGVGSTSTSLTSYPKTGQVTQGDIWVDPNAASNGSGTEGSPYDNLTDALTAVADGERIIVREGTINLTSTISRSENWANGIEVYAYGDERVTIDCTSLGENRAFSLSGEREHWKGFEIQNGDDGAMLITGSHYTIEDFVAHHMGQHGLGGGMFYIFGHANTGNVLQDCVAYRNGDGSSTGTNTPDNFKAHANYGDSTEVASGHAFVRCFAANAPDDNYDMFYGHGNTFLDCVSVEPGYYWDGTRAADGTGFKLGSSNTNTGNATVRGCVGIGAYNVSINDNGAPEAQDISFCTVVEDDFRPIRADASGSTVQNCVEYDNADAVDVVGDTYNTWNSSSDAGGNSDFPVSNPTFVDKANYDLSLDSGSPCIGAASDGDNLGASEVALEIAFEWLAKDLT